MAVTAERNLEWGGGGGMVESRRHDPSRETRPGLASGNFENQIFENAISCDLVIKF